MKKLLALLLAFVIVFAFCACGAQDDNTEDTIASTGETTESTGNTEYYYDEYYYDEYYYDEYYYDEYYYDEYYYDDSIFEEEPEFVFEDEV